METNPDLGDIEVADRPKNHTTTGNVTQVVLGTRAELYELDDDEEPKYGSRDDRLLNLEVEVEVKGDTFTIFEDMRYYENPSDRSTIGKYVKRYGTPEAGQEVTVDFDDEGDAKIVV